LLFASVCCFIGDNAIKEGAMTDVMIAVPTNLMKTLVARVDFQGNKHGKFVTAEEAQNFNGDYGHKMREYLQDDDTTCIAVGHTGELFEMPNTWSFDDAQGDGLQILFAFTVPNGLPEWTGFAALPTINKRYAQKANA